MVTTRELWMVAALCMNPFRRRVVTDTTDTVPNMRIIASLLLTAMLCFVALLCTLCAVLVQLLPLFTVAAIVVATVKVFEARRDRSTARDVGWSNAPSVARVPAYPAAGWAYVPVWTQDRALPARQVIDAFVIEDPGDG